MTAPNAIDAQSAATRRLSAGLLWGAGALLLLLAVGYNELLLGALFEQERSMRVALRWTQATFLLGGLSLVVVGRALGRGGWLGALAGRSIAPKLLLVCMVTLLPLVAIELMLRPFAPVDPDAQGGARTTIFERDAALGWKLRPGARDVWGDTPVEINAKGLRGPELDYEKPEGVRRILYLGDSVTFGYGLAGHERTFPYLTEPILEEEIAAEIETINAGVGGYSPWQQQLFLEREGIRYDPDLVVLCFVLNDVVEKFELMRFGGGGQGYQLAHAARSRVDALLSASAIGRVGRRLQARLRYGDDLPAGAAALETLGIRELTGNPRGERVRMAWEITLANVDKIRVFCESREIPMLIVVFPYDFQLANAKRYAAPQIRLRRFGAERGLPVLDLLPEFASHPRESLFLDHCHLTVEGHQLAAQHIAAALSRIGWQ